VSKRSDSGLDGILLVDKPQGWTSHDVVAKVRRITGQRRIGHTGTLDPMATGLLVLCLGNATRLVEFLTGHDKRYTGTVTLGRTTTTDDAEGETLAEFQTPTLNLQPTVSLLRARLVRRIGSRQVRRSHLPAPLSVH
jgi:tRNA pseudouridine55 synthase